MNIGIIIDFDIDPTRGGSYNYIYLVINKILSVGSRHNIVLISRKTGAQLKSEYKLSQSPQVLDLGRIEKRIDFLIIRLLAGLCRNFRILSGFLAELEERKRHSYHLFFKNNNIQALYYLPYNKHYTFETPYFFNVFDISHKTISYFPEIADGKHFEFWDHSFQKILPRAYKILAESEAGKKDLVFYYNIKAERIAVVPIFAGEVVHQPVSAEEAAHFLAENGLVKGSYLFYPAQFWAHKNHVNVLKAMHYLQNEQKLELKLVLCGSDKGNLAYVQKMIQALNLSDKVFCMGFLSFKETRILYENALALVMPTFLGPTNMPILEAMALDCAVICSDLEGHRELAGEGALYVAPDQFKSIAEAIALLAGDANARLELIGKARQQYQRSDHTLEKAVERVLREWDSFEPVRACWEG